MSAVGTDKAGPPMIHSITKLIDKIVSDGADYNTLINVLALFCLVSILNRDGSQTAGDRQPAASPQPATPNASSLQKMLGNLAKGDGSGPQLDTLMSLLPLLNSPQVKSKLNPSTMAALLGLMNNFCSSSSDKSESSSQDKIDKVDKTDKSEKTKQEKQLEKKVELSPESKNDTPAAAVTALVTETSPANIKPVMNPGNSDKNTQEPETERKGLGRYLNWKSHF